MSSVPDGIALERHRDLAGRSRWIWLRRALIGLLLAFVLLGLAGVFGQAPSTSTATAPAAELEVSAPSAVRGGLLYQARFRIRATHELKDAVLVLDQGWLENMTLDTIAPSPLGQASRDGKLALDLGHVPAGQQYVLYLQFQVNPTNVGRRAQNVELDDGPRRLAVVRRDVTVFP